MSLVATILTALALAASPVTLPPAAGVADYQLGGAYPPKAGVQIVVRDRSSAPSPGRYSVCYANSFQTQPGQLGWWKKSHPKLLLRDKKKRLIRDRGWPDEVLLDIRTSKKRAALAKINQRWFDRCRRDGFQGVEPDNLDSWTRSRKLIKKSHAVAMSKRLVRAAHRSGLAIAQKNAPELSAKRLGFDFAVAEECEVYRECGVYTKVYGTRLIEIEYTDNGRKAFTRACAARGGAASIMLRDRDVVPVGSRKYTYRVC